MNNMNNNYNHKKVGSNLYFHKSNTKAFHAQPYEFQSACQKAMNWMVLHDHKYEVIKYNAREGRISLIDAIGWDKLYEPITGTTYIFDEEGVFIRKLSNGKQVYHMKHLFVDDDYKGFDLEKSKKRTNTIEALPEIRDTRGIKSKIGALSFWNEFRDRHNLPAYMEGCEEDLTIFETPYTLHGVVLKPLKQMDKFVKEQEFHLFKSLSNVLEEFTMLRKLTYSQIDTNGLSVANRIMSKLTVYYQKYYFEMFMTLYKPWGGKSYPQAENFVTLDNKFMVRRFNGGWCCLPIERMSDFGIVTTKTPEDFEWQDRPEKYDTQLECMIGHFMERIRMFYLTPEQNNYFKNKQS